MATFVTIGYGDRQGYDSTPQAARDAAHAHDAQLLERGATMGIAERPTQVRNHDGAGVETADGPFMRADLPVAGFALIEAETLEQAIELAAGSPCAVAHGVIEVWPLRTTPQ
jgi:hypothetical protein